MIISDIDNLSDDTPKAFNTANTELSMKALEDKDLAWSHDIYNHIQRLCPTPKTTSLLQELPFYDEDIIKYSNHSSTHKTIDNKISPSQQALQYLVPPADQASSTLPEKMSLI